MAVVECDCSQDILDDPKLNFNWSAAQHALEADEVTVTVVDERTARNRCPRSLRTTLDRLGHDHGHGWMLIAKCRELGSFAARTILAALATGMFTLLLHESVARTLKSRPGLEAPVVLGACSFGVIASSSLLALVGAGTSFWRLFAASFIATGGWLGLAWSALMISFSAYSTLNYAVAAVSSLLVAGASFITLTMPGPDPSSSRRNRSPLRDTDSRHHVRKSPIPRPELRAV